MLDPDVDPGPSSLLVHASVRRSASPSTSNLLPPPSKRQKTTATTDPVAAHSPTAQGKRAKGRKKLLEHTIDISTTISTSYMPLDPAAVPASRSEKPSPTKDSQADGSIRCICGTHWDDGQMVQCDDCQTWQHTKCYRVDFERLKKDSEALWVCVVCDEAKWSHATLDSEWANRMQKSEEERERLAALAKQVESAAGRGNGHSRRGRGTGRRPNNISLDISSALAGRNIVQESDEETVDEPETWRKVYVSIEHNIGDESSAPHIRSFLQTYGPKSQFVAKSVQRHYGWATPDPKGKGKAIEIGDYDYLDRSMPIIVSDRELRAAEDEAWVTVRAKYSGPLPTQPARSSKSPAPRPSTSNAAATLAPPPPALESVQPATSWSYANVFQRATGQTNPVPKPPNPVLTTTAQSTPQRPGRTSTSPAPDARRGAASPITVRGAKGADDGAPKVQDRVPTQDPYVAQEYSLHASQPIPPRTLIALYPASLSSHASYLKTSSNQYLRLGTPKPHVRMMPPPLPLILDSRVLGGIGRFARSGCWPNSVLRSVVLKGRQDKSLKNHVGDPSEIVFGIFSLRELQEGEEVVLGWQWDDAHRLHRLPRLLLEEARQTLQGTNDETKDFERKYFSKLSFSLQEAFGGCACQDDPTLNGEAPLSGSSPRRRCALKTLSEWVERQKQREIAAKEMAMDKDDSERTEPDDTIPPQAPDPARKVIKPSIAHLSNPVTTPHAVTSHPSLSVPTHTSSPMPQSSSRGALAFITGPAFSPNDPLSRPSAPPESGPRVAIIHPTPQPPLMQPAPPLVAPTPRHSQVSMLWEPTRLPASTPRSSGPVSMAALIHESDTHPLSRPSSRQMSTPRSSNQLKVPVPQHRGATPLSASQELFQLWGRNVTAGALTARSDDTDEDILVRALDITLGPLIGAKRGVRIEDVEHGGLGMAKPVAGYGRVSSSLPKAAKRKRQDVEDGEDGEDGDLPLQKRRKQDVSLPPRLRSKQKRKRHVPRLSNGMDVDGERIATDSYEFTFRVPTSLSAHEMEAPNPDDIRESIMRVLEEQGMSIDVLNEAPSTPPPEASSAHQETRLTEVEASTPVPPIAPRSPTPPTQQPVVLTPKDETPPEVAHEVATENIASREGSPAKMQVDSTPEPPTINEENEMQDEHQVVQTLTKVSSFEQSVTAEPADETARAIPNEVPQSSNRPITPIPMIMPVVDSHRHWHSPAPSSVPEDHVLLPTEEPTVPESRSPTASDIETAPPPESMSPPPAIVVGRRLVTPDSDREQTPVVVAASRDQDNSSELSGDPDDYAENQDDEDERKSEGSEEEEDGSENGNDEEDEESSDFDTKQTFDDSGSLTPAPSPTPLPTSVQALPEVAQPSTPPPHQIALPAFESSLTSSSIVATQAELVQKEDDRALQEPSIASAPPKEAPALSTVPEHVLHQSNTPQSSPGPEDIPPPGSSADQPPSDKPQQTHIRRMTLKDYARKRKLAAVSPLPPSGPVATGYFAKMSSPGPAPAPTATEPVPTEEPVTPLTAALPRRDDATPLRVDLSPFPDPISLKREQSIEPLSLTSSQQAAVSSPTVANPPRPLPVSHPISRQLDTDRSLLPSPFPISSLDRETSPVSVRTVSSPPRHLPTVSSPRATSPADLNAIKMMEDGEIEASTTPSPSRTPAPSFGGSLPTRRSTSPMRSSSFADGKASQAPNQPRSMGPRANGAPSHAFPFNSQPSRSSTNGTPSRPPPPRSDRPPPSGPRALRGLDGRGPPPRHSDRPPDKPARAWDRDRDRSDMDRDRDRDRDHRLWRPRGGYPRG